LLDDRSATDTGQPIAKNAGALAMEVGERQCGNPLRFARLR
jgi:hypothetical protein